MASSPTWSVVSALLEELGKIRGTGSGFNTDFAGRVYTAEFNPAAGAEIGEGYIIVRFRDEEDGNDLTDGGEDYARPDLLIGIEAWIPESSQTPGVSSAMERVCRAGDDIVKAINRGVRDRAELASAEVLSVRRGSGVPSLQLARAIVMAKISYLADFASIGT